ncbi:50S ribosomal protein L15 [Patescibacteria group bacterium]|nr:50S ribosomal protein L15 [Patescibacteria group bacterium]MBU1448286.1 50S ribosomal protein L15 [Patescibacteria group bacterium]MBU2613100.1 50S ribosomal protein L15 [Patescibacteria group bacterium]
MTLSLHTMKPARGSRTTKKRVGRGNASGHGTTAGRGTKGQRARTGGRKRLKMKGMRAMLLSFPKQRGFTSTHPSVYDVRIGRVILAFQDGDRVDLAALKEKKIVPKAAVLAKVIGGGPVDKKLRFIGIRATVSVKAEVEKAGGSFEAAPKRLVKKGKDAKKKA